MAFNIRQKKLNQAASIVAEKLGFVLKNQEPVDFIEDPSMNRKGHLRLSWYFQDSEGNDKGGLLLRCEGGFGGGLSGTGYFKGTVQLLIDSKNPLNNVVEGLVHPWDYPANGPASSKATRQRFVEWANAFQPSHIKDRTS